MKIIFFAAALLLAFAARADITQTRSDVKSRGGFNCHVYLYTASGSQPKNLMLEVWGTGVYSMGAVDAIDPAALPLVTAGELAILTYDKPGLRRDTKSTEQMAAEYEDKDAFYGFTQQDLHDCAQKSLEWALTVVDAKKVFYHGHSEGTEIFVNMLQNLRQQNSPIAARFDTVFLSGLAMDTWSEIFDYQYKNDPVTLAKIKPAIDNCDNDFLMSNFENACAYFKAAWNMAPNKDILKSFWANPPAIHFRILHGLQDQYTPSQSVIDFDQANSARLQNNQPALDFVARYYTGLHSYVKNPAEVHDLGVMLTEALAK